MNLHFGKAKCCLQNAQTQSSCIFCKNEDNGEVDSYYLQSPPVCPLQNYANTTMLVRVGEPPPASPKNGWHKCHS